MNLGIPLGRPQGTQGLLSCGAMQVHSPLEPEKSSVMHPVWLTIRIGGFLSRRHKAVTTTIVFKSVLSVTVRVSAVGQMCPGVHWNIGHLLKFWHDPREILSSITWTPAF